MEFEDAVHSFGDKSEELAGAIWRALRDACMCTTYIWTQTALDIDMAFLADRLIPLDKIILAPAPSVFGRRPR